MYPSEFSWAEGEKKKKKIRDLDHITFTSLLLKKAEKKSYFILPPYHASPGT